MKQQFPVSQERKCAIKVATAHANSIAIVIEGNNGRYHKIECPRCDNFAVLWLGKAILIEDELAIGTELAKLHCEIFFDDGRKNALFHPPCALN